MGQSQSDDIMFGGVCLVVGDKVCCLRLRCLSFHFLCDFILDLEVMENEAKICLKLKHPNIGICDVLLDSFFYKNYFYFTLLIII